MNAVLTSYWEQLDSKKPITPELVLEITAGKGTDVEELASFWDRKIPGILEKVSKTYLDAVLDALPSHPLPQQQDVANLVAQLTRSGFDQNNIRKYLTNRFKKRVNASSPAWAIEAMVAMIEYHLNNYVFSMNRAGFAECEKMIPHFGKALCNTPRDIDAELTLLRVEFRKAIAFVNVFPDFNSRN